MVVAGGTVVVVVEVVVVELTVVVVDVVVVVVVVVPHVLVASSQIGAGEKQGSPLCVQIPLAHVSTPLQKIESSQALVLLVNVHTVATQVSVVH